VSAPRPESDLLTLTEVATRVGVTVQTVHTWVDRGLIPVAARERYGGGSRRWVRWADVRAFGELHAIGRERPAWLDEPDPPASRARTQRRRPVRV
jgi:hypothetical protein